MNNVDHGRLKRLANVREKQIAAKTKSVGGRKTIGSGFLKTDPSDVSLPDYLIDDKTLGDSQYTQTLDRRWFVKVREEAFSKGKKDGLISFDFGCGFDCIAGSFDSWLELVQRNQDMEKKIDSIEKLIKKCVTEDYGYEELVKELYRNFILK